MSERDFRPVSKANPCPACGKPDWCAWTKAGYLKCERTSVTPTGFTFIRARGEGAVFAPSDKSAPGTPQASATSTGEKSVYFDSLEAGRQHWRERMKRPEDACFTYEDEHGEPLALTLRFNKAGGKKSFLPVSRAPGGQWWDKALPKPWPLYRLSTLSDAETVLLVEGEGAADVAARCGFTATTNWGGAGKAEHADYTPLAGKTVYVIPDNDVAGSRHAKAAAQACRTAGAASVFWLDLTRRWPDFAHKGDLVDALALTEGDCEALASELRLLMDSAFKTPQTIDEKAPRGLRAVTRCLADVEPKEIDWLWDLRLAISKLSMIAGHPGLGKSFVTLDLAARVSTGAPWPTEKPGVTREPAGVVLVGAEDGIEDTICPRLIAAGADMTRIRAIEAVVDDEDKERSFSLTEHLEQLTEAIEACPDCRLVVIDPISAFLPNIDTHRDADVRSVFAPLAKLAEKHAVAILIVAHLNKGEGGAAITRVSGSMGFIAAVRAGWLITRDHEDKTRRLITQAKNNLAPDIDGLAYTLVGEGQDTRVEWEPDTVEIDADDALRWANAGPREPTKVESAAEWLMDYLAGGESVAVDELKRAAAQEGHAWGTVERAKSMARVRTEKGGFEGGWTWSIPVSEPSAEDAQPDTQPV